MIIQVVQVVAVRQRAVFPAVGFLSTSAGVVGRNIVKSAIVTSARNAVQQVARKLAKYTPDS